MKKTESGQALLIILLVMAVGLTISLAVVSRSITDIKISQQEEESARAFSVAEGGIEQALITGEGGEYSIGDMTARVTQTAQGGETAFIFPGEIQRGDIQTVWLVEHDEDGNLDPSESYNGSIIELYWGSQGQGATEDTTPAIEAMIIYVDDTVKVFRATFDPNAGRRSINNFGEADVGTFNIDAGGQTHTFPFRGVINPLPFGTPYALRLKFFYNDEAQAMGVRGNNLFPSQGQCFESCGTVSETEVTRCVQQCQFYKSPPGIFDYVLFSEGNLSQP